MKTFLCAWFGTLVFCGLFLALFSALVGEALLWLLPVTLIAILITAFSTLFKEAEELRARIKRLEEQVLDGRASGQEEPREAVQEKLEEPEK